MITPGNNAIASDFISSSAGAGDVGKVPKLNASGKLDDSFLNGKFGGTGADGDLSIASGTTNIDLGGVKHFIKNYTSISITGTGALTFTNPHASGTQVSLLSQGAVALTSSATRLIDMRSLGGSDGNGWSGNSGGQFVSYVQSGGSSSSATGNATGGNAVPGSSQGFSNAGGSPSVYLGPKSGGTSNPPISQLSKNVYPGGGGMSSGRGGGGLYIECKGALNFTGTIDAGGTSTGAGGSVLILYNTLTTDSGTITITGAGGGSVGQSLVASNINYA